MTNHRWPATGSGGGFTSVPSVGDLPASGASGFYLAEDTGLVYYWTGVAWVQIQYQALAEKDLANGYAGLDAGGKILGSQIPSLAITNVFTTSSEVAMLALPAEQGDVCIRTDLDVTYMLSTSDPTVLANWISIETIRAASATEAGMVSLTAQTLGAGVKTITDGVATKQTQYTTGLGAPAYSEGLTFWDNDNKCLAQYNDVAAVTQQIGQETFIRVYNDSGAQIDDGKICYLSGSFGGFPTIGLARSDSVSTCLSTIGFSTHAIPDGTYGYITISGIVRNIDTSGCVSGSTLFLSSTVAGSYQTIIPDSPNFNIKVGNCVVIDAAVGTIFAQVDVGNNIAGVIKIFNGAILEDHSVLVTSDGAIVSLTLEKKGGGDLNLIFDSNFTLLDCTPPASVALSAGSDTIATLNYVFVPKSTNVLTANTSGFPTDEQVVPVATVYVQSAASAQTYGVYKVHAWTDHLSDSVDQGHLSHLNKWIRLKNATWLSGIVPTISGTGTATIGLSNTSGQVMQLHEHGFPAFVDPADVYVVNDLATPYNRVSNLADIVADATGATLLNTTFVIVLWGSVSESDSDCKWFANLPNGSYQVNKPDLTRLDSAGYTNYSIPAEFKGTGFLVKRLVMSINAGGTAWTVYDDPSDDIRGLEPNTTVGSGIGATITDFTDNVFRVSNVVDTTKKMAIDSSSIATATTRTYVAPDQNGTLLLEAGIQTTTNKTQGDALTITDIATPSTPAAGFKKTYSKTDGLYVLDSAGVERRVGNGLYHVAIDHTTTALSMNTFYTIDMSGASGDVTFTFPNMIAGDQFLCNVIGNDTNGYLATFKTTTPQNIYYRGDTDTTAQLAVPDTWLGGAWDSNNSYVALYDASTFLSGNLAGDWNVEGDLTVDTDTLVVDATNDRVGIGTASPSTYFQIDANGGNTALHTIAILDANQGVTGAAKITFQATRNDSVVGSRYAVINADDGGSTARQLKIQNNGGVTYFGGDVGIGTASPSQALQVIGEALATQVRATGGTDPGTSTALFSNGGTIGSLAAFALNFNTGANGSARTTRMEIGNTGNVGIGTTAQSTIRTYINGSGSTSATYSLYVGNSTRNICAARDDGVFLTLSGAVDGTLSDIRLKQNLKPITDALSTICSLNPTFFDWKHPEKHTDKTQAGFIAQEVQAIKPNWVQRGDAHVDELQAENLKADEVLTTKFSDMQAYIVKAIQEQQTLIESLTARIEALEGNI